jgi:hypothetical protein
VIVNKLTLYIEKNANIIVAAIIALYLFAGGAYSILLGDQLRYWDEKHYLALALNLHDLSYSFDGLRPTAFQPPGYPITLFLASSLKFSVPLLRFLNFVFLGLSMLMAFLLLKKYISSLCAVISVILIAVYPLFFYSAGTLYPQTEEIFLLMLFLSLASREETSLANDFLLGIVMGALILVSPLFLLYLPVLFLYPFIFQGDRKLPRIIFFLLACALIVGSWSIRNYLVLDRFVLISTNGGVNLLLGNSENTTPDAGVNVDLSKYNIGYSYNEVDQDKYFDNQAVLWMKKNPEQALKLYILKALNFFNYSNELASKNEHSAIRNLISFISYYPLLILFFLRLALHKRFPLTKIELFIVILYLISPFLQAIFFTRIRFRIPFDFCMILIAASIISKLWKSSLDKKIVT